MNTLLVLTKQADPYAQLLRRQDLPDLEMVFADSVEQGRRLIGNVDIILGQPAMAAQLLDDAVQLKWVQSVYAGVESLCAAGLRTDYLLTGVKGVFGALISEYVFAYVLALERRLFEMRRNQQARTWRDMPYRRLCDLTMGICGLGAIGRHVAGTARHFGMRVTGCKRTPATIAECDAVYTTADLPDFLSAPDYVVITLPDTKETHAMFDAAALRSMKPDAVLINVGRGSVVVEDDLIEALDQGRIRGAVLDVFTQEPLPAASPLWDKSNVWITPHNSGTSYAPDIVRIFCDNYRRFVQGRKLKYAVDFDKGY